MEFVPETYTGFDPDPPASVSQVEDENHGGEEQVKLVLNTFSRAEEVLENTDIEHYDKILTSVEQIFSALNRFEPRIPLNPQVRTPKFYLYRLRFCCFND